MTTVGTRNPGLIPLSECTLSNASSPITIDGLNELFVFSNKIKGVGVSEWMWARKSAIYQIYMTGELTMLRERCLKERTHEQENSPILLHPFPNERKSVFLINPRAKHLSMHQLINMQKNYELEMGKQEWLHRLFLYHLEASTNYYSLQSYLDHIKFAFQYSF